MTIEEKYNIIYENGKRYYKVNLTDHLVMEHVIPHRLTRGELVIEDNTWVHMTEKLVIELDKLNPKSEEELLNLSYPWAKIPVFSRTKRANYTQIKNLYLNTNHNASRARMNIMFLIEAYGFKPEEFDLIVKMHPSAEHDDAREYFANKTKEAIAKYINDNGGNDEIAEKYISNINKINEILKEISQGYDNFFLFDDYNMFLNYKSKLMQEVKDRGFTQKKKDTIKKTLDVLGEVYKSLRK